MRADQKRPEGILNPPTQKKKRILVTRLGAKSLELIRRLPTCISTHKKKRINRGKKNKEEDAL